MRLEPYRTPVAVTSFLFLLVAVFSVCLAAPAPPGRYRSGDGNFYAPGSAEISVQHIDRVGMYPRHLTVYAPVSCPEPCPVIVFFHGFAASADWYETVLKHIASLGFVVVAPQMYPPESPLRTPPPFLEALRGAVLVKWLQAHINRYVAGAADTGLIGLAGHSRGGQAAWRVALLLPEDIKAVAGLDPVDALAEFGQRPVMTGPLDIAVPSLVVGTGLGPEIPDNGSLTSACAPAEIGHEIFFDCVPSPAWHAVATGYGHTDMIDEEEFTPESLVGLCPGGSDRELMRDYCAGVIVAFFTGTLLMDQRALSLLTDPDSAPIAVTLEWK